MYTWSNIVFIPQILFLLVRGYEAQKNSIFPWPGPMIVPPDDSVVKLRK